ncbi:MAG TPA: zf-HC2 domain-containing protein [Pyrinomonadaceae bacterium]
MRCEDCLPLIEEYFDGEVEETAAARMGAHLSACATCAAALDALSFEQEIYARYDRRLEAGPDLWARVSAEVAREPHVAPGRPDAPRPFLSGLRAALAAGLGAVALRPALASSLALLVVGVTAGSLWLARRQQTVNAPEVAQSVPAAPARTIPAPPAVAPTNGVVAPDQNSGSLKVDGPAVNIAAEGPARAAQRRGAAGRTGTIVIAPGLSVAEDDVERLLATPSAPPANPAIIELRPEGHAVAADDAALVADVAVGEAVAASARPLPDPSEKEVARHVEQTQMLLRSIKNAPANGAAAVDVAYEKNLSRKLLAEGATLRLEAEVRGDRETRQVLDRIEPFLLDIANLRDRPSREEVRSIGERVRQNDIVAALEVY